MGSIRPSSEWRARNAELKRAKKDAAERAVLAAAKAWVHAYGTSDALDATPALIRAVEDLFALESKERGA